MYVTGWRVEGANDEIGPNDTQHIVWALAEDGRCQQWMYGDIKQKSGVKTKVHLI